MPAGAADLGIIPFQLRIGVTGHRRLPGDRDLPGRVAEALDRARALVPAPPGTPADVLVVSPLAEGADRLVARTALDHAGAVLEVPLPLPVEEYLQDFDTTESREEFQDLLTGAREVFVLPPMETREDAYQAVGYYVVDRADVLIAIWDGEPSRGPGGTAEVVDRARARGIPVLWIRTKPPCRIEKEIGRGIRAGSVQRFAHYNQAKVDTAGLRAHVAAMIDQVAAHADRARVDRNLVLPFADWIGPYFARSDALARRYRAYYVEFGNATFFLAAIAVIAFAWQIYFLPERTILAWFGMAPLLGLVVLLVLGRRWRLHQRWISYRTLAERFRTAGYLALVGRRQEDVGSRPYYNRSGAEDWQRRAFEAVWIRRPPPVTAESDLAGIKRFIADGWIRDQLAYHRRSAARNRRQHDRLTRASEILCGLTIVAALLYVLEIGGHDMSPALTWTTAQLVLVGVLPATAAALTGIRAQQEYLRNAERSRRLVPFLGAIADRLEWARDLTEVRAIVYEAEDMMLWTDRDWLATMEFHNFELHV